jgi:acyl-coenzyme A thioesterase PaaI-like protein
MPDDDKAFQDYYEEAEAVCYGCGPLNSRGLHIKSYWEGDEAVCRFQPQPYHTSFPGYVYGGLIASLIDCHSTGTAAAAAYRAEGRAMGSEPALRFVTGSLRVDYLKPTPIDGLLTVRATVQSIEGRVVTVLSELHAGGQVTARGEVVCVRVPEDWAAKHAG